MWRASSSPSSTRIWTNCHEALLNKPNRLEATFNRVFGWLVGLGLAPAGFYLLQVRGRKTGRVHSTPVDVLQLRDRTFLVAPRGETQWVRNARASGAVTLKRSRSDVVRGSRSGR